MQMRAEIKKRIVRRYLFISGCVVIFILFLWVVSQNFENYSTRKLRYQMRSSDAGKTMYKWPTIFVYENTSPYNVLRLKQLGFDFKQRCFAKDCSKFLRFPLENLTGNDLVWASWTPGELIEQVRFGNTVINYSMSDSHFEHWSLHFEENLPYLKLTPPPTDNGFDTLSITSRTDFNFPQCRGKYENGTTCGYTTEFNCSDHEMNACCNSSCEYELILRKYNFDKHYYAGTTLFMDMVHNEYTTTKTRTKFFVLSSSIFLEYYTKDTRLDDEVDVEDCWLECSREVTKPFNCVFLNKFTVNEPVLSNCYANKSVPLGSVLAKYSSYCGNKCSNSRQEFYWKSLRWDDIYLSGHANITLENKGIQTLFPIESYSLTQFLSDVGGSAGFFLEVAVMPLIIVLASYIARILLGQSKSINSKKFGLFCRVLLALGIGSLLIRDMYKIIDRIDVRYVAFKSKACYEGHDCVSPATAQDWLTSIYALPSLGCKPISLSTREGCLRECFLKSLSEQENDPNKWLAASIPVCSSRQSSKVLQDKVILEEHTLGFIESTVTVNLCELECSQESNVSSKTGVSFYPIEGNKALFSYLDIACSFCGLSGFYLGFSLLDITKFLRYVRSRFYRSNFSEHFFSLLQNVAIIIAVFIGFQMIFCKIFYYTTQRVLFRVTTIEQNSSTLHKLSLTICPITDPYYRYSEGETYSGLANLSIFDSLECRQDSKSGMSKQTNLHQSECISCTATNHQRQTGQVNIHSKVSSNLASDIFVLGFVHFDNEEIVWDGRVDAAPLFVYQTYGLINLDIFKPLNSDERDYQSVCYSKCIKPTIEFLEFKSKLRG